MNFVVNYKNAISTNVKKSIWLSAWKCVTLYEYVSSTTSQYAPALTASRRVEAFFTEINKKTTKSKDANTCLDIRCGAVLERMSLRQDNSRTPNQNISSDVFL